MWKENVYNKWWFSFIVIPAILFVFMIADAFAPGSNSYRWTYPLFILRWLTVGIVGFLLQFGFNIKHKVKQRWIQYLFSLIILLTTFVVTFFFKWILDITGDDKIYGLDKNTTIFKWVIQLINVVVASAILLVVKVIVWSALKLKGNQLKHIKDERDRFSMENKELNAKIDFMHKPFDDFLVTENTHIKKSGFWFKKKNHKSKK